MIQDSGIIPEIVSGILNFRDWDFRDSVLLKLPGLGFSGFRIPELQDFAGLPVFQFDELDFLSISNSNFAGYTQAVKT